MTPLEGGFVHSSEKLHALVPDTSTRGRGVIGSDRCKADDSST